MHNNGNGENAVSVPAGLVEQLQNLTTKGENSMQFAPGMPNPSPRPQQEVRAED
ncbi:MAG: hypothetical protein U1A73_00215 [Pseudomonas sp.]|nr:hypothetical protein [Xanthomonadaceae bacterium]MDZ4323438.1 hypothetical protein [Pseudomonas sp.]